MKDKIRVALVIPDLHVGGAERLLVDMVLTWRQQDKPIKTNVYSFKDGPIRDELETKGCPVSLSPGSHPINPLIIPWLMYNFIRDKIHVVHLHLPRAGFYGRLAAKILGLPVLYTEHNLWEVYRSSSRFFNKITYFLNTQVVTVSDAVMASIHRQSRYPAARITRVYNGIFPMDNIPPHNRLDACKKMGLPNDLKVAGTIANLHPRKGLNFLLHAIRSLLNEFPDLHCVIIGRDDGEESALRQLANELGIQHRVHWLGYRPDARELLAAFDVFVLPSLFEGLPVALIEAMDAGVPIVATRVGGNPELVIHGETGFLVTPSNPKELAMAISALLKDPVKRSQMGKAARVRMRAQFTVDHMANRYAKLYKALVYSEARTRVSS